MKLFTLLNTYHLINFSQEHYPFFLRKNPICMKLHSAVCLSVFPPILLCLCGLGDPLSPAALRAMTLMTTEMTLIKCGCDGILLKRRF